MQRLFLCLAVLTYFVLSGCAAQVKMMSMPGTESSSPYAPINEKTRGGLIRYLDEGGQEKREARREDAYKKMHDACGGKYRIESESEAHTMEHDYRYFQFSCAPEW